MPSVKSDVHSVLGRLIERIGVRSVAFEATQECNQDCTFCYNVWKSGEYPSGQLDTARTKYLLDRIIRGYRPQVLSFTGGEPLLRSDIVELIEHVSGRVSTNLITNGTLMTDDLARDLVRAKVRTFEFTLLSADRAVHNSLVGRESFDQVIDGIACVRAAGGNVATTFVAVSQNIGTWEEMLELNAALGVSGILFNRFNIGGAGIERAAELMPSVEQFEEALRSASEGAERFGISISCGVPIPPCVVEWDRYPNVHFSHCPVGTRKAYPTVDPLGNVRPCNHSPKVLGSLFEADMRTILCSDAAAEYGSGVPDECRECEHSSACRGGCRAASEVCGDACGIDPFVRLCQGTYRTG